MKTLTLNLKKTVLIVDAMSEEIANGIIVQEYGVKTLSEYKFLCQGTPTEEQAAELVEKAMNDEFFLNSYSKLIIDRWHNKAQNAFLSAVSAENWYYLVNPMGDEPKITEERYKSEREFMDNNPEESVFGDHYADWSMWQEAEYRTFKNPIIFIKE